MRPTPFEHVAKQPVFGRSRHRRQRSRRRTGSRGSLGLLRAIWEKPIHF
jgi:hypothetical protein